MVKTWAQYTDRIEKHYASNHSKDGTNEDPSCDVCFPPNISIADPTYIHFINWFKKTYGMRYHTSRTVTYYTLAVKNLSERKKWLTYVITSIRYSEKQNFTEMIEEVLEMWKETDGFQNVTKQGTSVASTQSK